MTSELPEPGSIWQRKKSHALYRAVLISHHEIVCHNCEIAIRHPEAPLISWAGSPSQFERQFHPAPADLYPETATI